MFLSIGDFLNISSILCQQERYEEALESARTAIQTEPIKAHVQMAAICYNLGDALGMEQNVNAGLAHDVTYPKLHEARGVIRLGRGDIIGGFEDWKLRTWPRVGKDLTRSSMPEWDGVSRLDGKTVWILQEQGIGDQLLWARSLHGFCERTGAAQLVLALTPGLERLMANSIPGVRCVTSTSTDLPEADTWASIATVQINSPETVAWQDAYIHATTEDINRMSHLIPRTGRLRVGICWAGSPGYYIDRDRSLPFSAFSPILAVDGVDFYSLQFGHSSAENNLIPDLALECRDFADTAALLHSLDLVITVDTALANLCGAMGLPCWVMVRPPIDFRWGMPNERNDWFGPNIRQFRSTIPSVVAGELAKMVTQEMRAVHRAPYIPSASVVRVDTRYGSMDIFNHGIWCNRSLKLYGEWSELEMDVMREMCPQGGTVIEAGANVGSHTLGLMQWAGTVWAFEPHPETYALLQANVLRNNPTAIMHCYHAGLGKESAQGIMEAHTANQPFNPGGAMLRIVADGDIDITTIDSLEIEEVHLIKADVEGHEMAVIEGAEQTISRCRPVIYLEDNDVASRNDLYALLDSWNYRLHRHKVSIWNPKNWRGGTVNAFGGHYSEMLLAVPKERTDLLESRFCQGKPC